MQSASLEGAEEGNTETETEAGAEHLSWQCQLGRGRVTHGLAAPAPTLQWSLTSLALQCLREATGQKKQEARLTQVSVFSRGAVNNTSSHLSVYRFRWYFNDLHGDKLFCSIMRLQGLFRQSQVCQLGDTPTLFSPGNCMNLISR